MPTGKNWIHFIYINLAFALYIVGTYYLSSLQEIKANWPLYRCNPLYMPLSDNMEKDFNYCVQNMTTGFMGYLLQPLTFITGSLTNMASSFTNEINAIRGMFNKIRTFISSITESIFGVFLNLIIEFQKIIIGIKDLMGKTIGIMVSLMYILDGSIKTMNSTWNGPPGQIVKSLGKCFHPETKIKLKNGNIILMKNINLGDVLENGSIVESIMKIDNKIEPEPFYILNKCGVDKEDIYVTGSHLVFDNEKNKFVKTENYTKAMKSNLVVDWFSCLITNDHKIKIGDEVFWDWEDHYVKPFIF
jgi:hypothetical protein